MNRILKIINLVISILLVFAAIATWWFIYRPLPQTSGTLDLPIGKPATVIRDGRGVPSITAGSLEDAVFLQGFVHAQDRLWQMDALRRLAAGELSEIVGAAALEADQDSRRLRMRRVAEQHYGALSATDRAVLAAYARGVNHFIETHQDRLPVEFSMLGYDPKPWSAVDSILAGLHMFRSLTTTWKDEVLKRNMLSKGEPDKVNFLFPSRTGGEAHPGSNAWAIAGKFTASGKPILANDTHLEWSFPGPWYQVHLRTPEVHVAGFSLPGMPMVVIGHNERIAWGITNLHFDVQDLYLEKFDPQSGRYVFRNQVEQARLERETIRVKGGQTVELPVWVTRHGPVFLISGNAHFALRWAGAEDGGFRLPFLDMARAQDWPQFTAAISNFPGPGSNFLYADTSGNIGYHAAGKLPIRKSYDGDVPTDGSAGESEWEGLIPFDQLPSAYNPPSGMLVSSNQNPFPKDYPYRVHGNFSSHYRSRQVEARLRSRSGWKAEEMLGVATDIYSDFSFRLAREVYRIWDKRGRNNPSLTTAAEVLKAWDGQMRQGLAAPLLVTLIFQQFRKAAAERAAPGQGSAYELQMAPAVLDQLMATRPKDWFADFDAVLLKCFADAVEEGKRLQNSDPARWDYGRYTQFTLQNPVVSRLPYFGKWFNVGPAPMSGASTTVKQTTRRLGPSMRFIADLSNWDNSMANVTLGQSGQPLSSHFRDQWDAYYNGRSFPMQFGKVDGPDTLRVQPGR